MFFDKPFLFRAQIVGMHVVRIKKETVCQSHGVAAVLATVPDHERSTDRPFVASFRNGRGTEVAGIRKVRPLT